ncbi:MAG TPA: type II CRISPR RNA-guided endonuclease Cas9 [Candidatus Fimihabitans intestinipullorum]|uniref:CRISPR-associated endonuclease Cas9 n=1 Tax=Candidatus Fimihabitans intestinipullorum TaxID=2840820 RepID=A0A9D1L2V2_9BACT|nr:type II CRISPR RNA-guided endonuclease Cas9 [Candidatus Fimihabitans intestinipullorum]
MEQQKREYNIGLDIGTTSVGWAVVEDKTQKILRKGKGKKRKSLWGVRLFEAASTAEKRRNYRSTRRRYDRRRERIRLLQEEFKEEINKVDPTFFKKLQESKYDENDKLNKTILLTSDEKEQIKEYNNKYKTIYHLRKNLMDDKSKADIRLVYLAIHHIIKYRGNFLYEGKFNVNDLDLSSKLKAVFRELSESVSRLDISLDILSQMDYAKMENIIMNKSKNDIKVDLKNELKDISENKKFATEFGKLITGGKFVVKDLFMIDSDDKLSISFSGNDFDDKYLDLEKMLGDELSVLELLKQLYDIVFLKKIFKGRDYVSISYLMVDKYEEHKNDLAFLKAVFDYDRKKYNEMFRSRKATKKNKKYVCIYEQYIHNVITFDEFRKKLENYLIDLLDVVKDESLIKQYNDNKLRIENGEFLPRITDPENGKYPYQINMNELKKIIENQGAYYPFLLDMVNGEYKITKLLEFKIPYYVGPLNKHSRFAWIERKDNIKITPYNFDEVIDKETTAEKFIKRMTSKCTYLLEEDALPNNSIFYCKFKVLNELKQIKINGHKIENNIQNEILAKLFMTTSGSITDKKFKEYIHASKDFDMYEGDITVTGYSDDGKFANNMQSYVDFFGEEGIFNGTSYNEIDADEIIEWITIFDDKDILEKKVRNKYSELKDLQIKKILNKKYKGWGRLSKKLLYGIYYKDKKTGINKSIMDLMYETSDNFMQIINDDKYKFQDRINEENSVSEKIKLNYSLVEGLATSPATKKGIYQSLKVIDEIIKIMGYKPKNIMIEMAREDGKKERKNDRKKYLEKIYKKAQEVTDEYNSDLQKVQKRLKEYEKIDSEKLFLYFIQEGKCLYSGETIYLEDLNTKKLEVDHILPQSLIKDNSIDNKALVYRDFNQNKKDKLVLPENYRTPDQIRWWEHLKKVNLMSAKKFYRLTRKIYKDEEIQGFINRQLVETRQITKHVANIITNLYNTNVVYLKANLSHNYRERYELYKFRELNNYHHAFDAYLAAILGEYKEEYMKKDINYDMIKTLNEHLKEMKDYKRLKYGFVINSLDNQFSDIVNQVTGNLIDSETGEVLFDINEFNRKVEATYYRNDILVSKKTEIKSGKLYDETKNKKGLSGVPLKSNMPTELYGSYTNLYPSYAVVVKITKKGKESQKMIGMPIYITQLKNEGLKDNYIKTLLSLKDSDKYEIISKPIPFFTKLNWNGQICSLVGATDKVEVCNALELTINKEDMMKFKNTLNRLLNQKRDSIDDAQYTENINMLIEYMYNKIATTYKLYNNLAEQLREIIDDNKDCSLEQKEKFVVQLLGLLKCNSVTANLKFLNDKYSMAFGKKHGRTIEHAIVYNQSVTGIRESTYEF